MRKYLAGLFLLLSISCAQAGVSCSVPFNLTNGTTADASQVMANYNAILSCLANGTAENGANSSITSLSGLTTPLSPSQGGTTWFLGGTSTGTNTVAVASTSPNTFSLTAGYCVSWIVGVTNTNASTLAVAAQAAKNIYKQTYAGAVALTGSEMVAGHLALACYDGTQFQLENSGAFATFISTLASLSVVDQTLSGGANVTSFSLGTLSTGTTTIDCGKSPLQYGTNGGTFTIAAPAADGSCLIYLVNNGSAVAPSFSGFTVGSNIGDTYITTNTNKFTISIWRINGVSSYFVKAMQ